jgi:hypothetical protein
MKTLFQQLKPEVLELLELEALEYPATMERLKDIMESIFYWHQLAISDATRLVQINNKYTRFDLEAVSNLFNEEA